MPYAEYNFDGLVGPTHNYAGLGSGNLASMASKDRVSNPRAAALEGLAKMRLLAEMGVPQAVLPPQRRPHVGYLRLKYAASPGATASPEGEAVSGDDGHGLPFGSSRGTRTERPSVAEVAALLRKAAENGDAGRRDLVIASSASAMWAANAATVSPSPDTADGRCHFTVANLVSQPHRALEAAERMRVFGHLFGDQKRFAVHPPLEADYDGMSESEREFFEPWDDHPQIAALADEGAANHTRLSRSYGDRGSLEVFTFGRSTDFDALNRGRFVPRQAEEASRAVGQLHGLLPERSTLVHQNEAATDAGVFHNDVISVANENLLLIHEIAWSDQAGAVAELESAFSDLLHVIKFTSPWLTLADAVRSYLFNSQLVTLPSGGMALIYPAECDAVPSAKAAIERILREDNPVERAVRVDVRQSMNNGGGPACLRLRVVLSDAERAAVRGNVFWTPTLHQALEDWVRRHYRASLSPADLADVRLFEESERALDELAGILDLPI